MKPAAQLGPSSEEKKEVVGRLERLMEEAVERGVKMIGFPELCLMVCLPAEVDPQPRRSTRI
jgi:predicted amidohydrolase